MMLPEKFTTEEELEEFMSRPTPALVEMMKNLTGDIMILGIAGKMGITLGMLALRAIKESGITKKIYGVARFSNQDDKKKLEEIGISTIKCDLLDRKSISELPKVANILFMAGRKFGTDGAEAATWAANTLIPANVCEHFVESKIVAFSTGCVYPLVEHTSGGSKELEGANPVGEYAQSCLGRERIFEHYSQQNGTPVCIYRLNYAIDLRYGVLREIGETIFNGKMFDLSMGYFNIIWQGDANVRALLCLEHCSSPAETINITGREILKSKDVAEEFSQLFDTKVSFTRKENTTALLNNATKSMDIFGETQVKPEDMIRWTAEWLKDGGKSLNKATHFQTRNGKF